jgi:hypothetical protein
MEREGPDHGRRPHPWPAGRGGAVRWFFTDPATGTLAVAQWPNLPLAVFLAATAVRILTRPEGAAGTAVAVVGGSAIAVWAVLEVVRGDSPFRRLLGAVVLVVTAAGVLGG